jgi:3-hydroxy-5-methyl-1-naphthoate 3-O-methyltransferase
MADQRPPERNPIVRALAGWQPARVLMTANRLDVFNVIGGDARGASEIARRCDAHPRSMRLLLDACVALGFLEKRHQRYLNTPLGLHMLVKGGGAFIGDGINHSDVLWNRWAHLTESVRTNSAPPPTEGPVDPKTGYRDFILAMHDRAMRNGQELAENLDLRGRRQLFDCGGGPGTYSVFLVKKNAGLRAILFDLPPATEIAIELISEAGYADRIATRAGNYWVDDFGQGNDVVLLSAIVHSMAPQRAKVLLRKAFDSLISGGIVVIHETLVDASGVAPVGAVLFSLNMLVNTDGGRSYSGREIMSWIRDTGFASPRVQDLPSGGSSLVVGTKP